jgi:hypothetical protein
MSPTTPAAAHETDQVARSGGRPIGYDPALAW